MRVQQLTTLAAAVAAAGALACSSDSTAPKGSAPVSLSFSAAASGATLSRSADVSVASTSSADVLVISTAQLVLARVELVRAGATCTSETASGDDDGVDDNDCAELELAPTVVDLPVTGTVVNALSVTIPEGTYSSIEAKLRPVRASSDRGRGSSAFLTAHPDLDGVSVLVTGTFNGVAFTYKGTVSAGIERQFASPLTVTSDKPLNVNVNADLATWFRNGANGPVIDPSTANAGGANAQLVADNIKRSFKAFRDDDHNGHDDDGPNHT
jgi:hypothetical protein